MYSLPPSRLVQPSSPAILLSPEQMTKADTLAIAGGIDCMTLMKNAGYAVAREIEKHWSPRPVLVVCGPGNNGGDGFVIASYLRGAGWHVSVTLMGPVDALSGDAATAAKLWHDEILSIDSEDILQEVELVVDAVFGAGLNRDFTGPALDLLRRASDQDIPIVAVDIPSGVDGATGRVLGDAVPANLTVTFFRMKPGHKLLPGRDLCGALILADIGIPSDVCLDIASQTWVNQPGLWLLPELNADSHKYTRGHTLVVGGQMSGASRLAVRAARRIGSGLVSILCPHHLLTVYASDAPGAIILAHEGDGLTTLAEQLNDPRKNAILIGPGYGLEGPEKNILQQKILKVLGSGRACVLDADALGAFVDHPEDLFKAIKGPTILTPHAGEFAKLFPDLKGDRLSNVRAAAQRCQAVVVLKGSDTVIAAPDGKALINDNAPPVLATAGAGDVLAGLIVGLLAQGMRPLAAAAAGVWIHGDAARRFGYGLIAEDLPEQLPKVLSALHVPSE